MSEQSRKAIESLQQAGSEFTEKLVKDAFNVYTSAYLLTKCKCGKTPVFADVGGVNPYYELCCPCGKSPVIGSYNKEEVINTWNILNERSGE